MAAGRSSKRQWQKLCSKQSPQEGHSQKWSADQRTQDRWHQWAQQAGHPQAHVHRVEL